MLKDEILPELNERECDEEKFIVFTHVSDVVETVTLR